VTTYGLAIHQNFKLGPSRRRGGRGARRYRRATQHKDGGKKTFLEGAFGKHCKTSFNESYGEYPAKIN
jgi:hypothetical protein